MGWVGDDAGDPWLRACRADRRRECVAVRVADLPALEWRIEVDDLVAGREHRDAGPLANTDTGSADRREKADLRRPKHRARGEDPLALPEILSRRAGRHPLRRRRGDGHDVARVVGVLD